VISKERWQSAASAINERLDNWLDGKEHLNVALTDESGKIVLIRVFKPMDQEAYDKLREEQREP